MSNENGEIQVKALLTILIAETLDFFSIGKTMSDTQVAMMVNLILEDYSIYKPDYFILCFKRAKKGNYGITYDRIDGSVIFGWLAKFDEEYTLEIENERINEHKKNTSTRVSFGDYSVIPENHWDNLPVPMPENVKELLKNNFTKTLPVKLPELSKEQLFSRSIKADFEAICEQNGEKGDAFVFFHGTTGMAMNIQEYTNYRFLILEKPFFYKRRF